MKHYDNNMCHVAIQLMQENTLLQQRLFTTEQAQDRLHEEV
jgi:hypothetical protein